MKAFCSNCGGSIEFRFEQAVQTTCPYCRSIIVRTDVDLRIVGKVADLPPSMSPIQIGTEGKYKGQAFTVAGRIIYDWEQGSWNEWHIVFQDGRSAWLSDAQAEYAVTRSAPFPSADIEPGQFFAGRKVTIANRDFTVAVKTQARYRGVEGELPFEYWDKSAIELIDLRSSGNEFATIDFSESPPLLFFGESVEFGDLALTNLKEESPVGGPTASAAALSCPNCGAGVEIRAQGQTVSVVCGSCAAVLDATAPSLQILQRAQSTRRVPPAIPLGAKGKFDSEIWQNIGMQCRAITADGVTYEWREYVLFNEHRGFRYLTEYNGHWNDVKPVRNLPAPGTAGGKPIQTWMGRTYRHFQTAIAETTYVVGEFPWRVAVGEKVSADDYVSPPYMLSAERTPNEVTWSHGEYVPGAEIWQRFGLKTAPPKAEGIYANQPSPYIGSAGSAWRTYGVLALLLIGSYIFMSLFMGNRKVFEAKYRFDPTQKAEASFVTPVFELQGRPSNVEATIDSDVDNNWVYFNLALVNEDTGQALEWGREVSYYSGRDSDGSWSEGGRTDRSKLSHVPAGHYYLRVEPEWEPPATVPQAWAPLVNYTITLRRDVTIFWPYLVALILLLVPAIAISIKSWSFENSRWQESDYASSGGGDSSDD
jgi:predicted RNA-binding Zn-ribbon protein involved in translation (DUF1610 family)